MYLLNTVRDIFSQLNHLLRQLKQEDYKASVELLSDNSIGKHVRHVLEFFDLLIDSAGKDGIVNYDKRKHDRQLESEKVTAELKIMELLDKIETIKEDQELMLEASYSTNDDRGTLVKTSFNRELVYNIEHAIHHMAIIKIAVSTLFPYVNLGKDFGIAYSTLKYNYQNER